MKAAANTRTSLLTVLFLTAFLLTSFGNSISAQSNDNAGILIPEKMSNNLAVGIKSDNEGLRNSSIYLAGYYMIDALTDDLVEQLKVEKEAKTRILITLALYRIGNEDGIEAVGRLAAREEDKEVRRIGIAVHNQFLADNNYGLATKGK